MSSIERWGADEHSNASHYLPVDPQTLGRLRILRVGDVELQLDGHRLLVRGTPVQLPHKEFVILRQLMDNAGRVVTRCELLDNAWGPDRADARNYLEVHIRRLRVKIENHADRPTHIRTVRGFGYIFDFPRDDGARHAVAEAPTGVPSPLQP
jgi:DNA-binding response OmpR family regulator